MISFWQSCLEYIDRRLHPKARKNQELLLRSRIFVICCTIATIFSIFSAVYLIALRPLGSLSLVIALFLLLQCVMYSTLIFSLRWHRSLTEASHMLLLSSLLPMVFTIYIDGGPIHSAGNSFTYILPVLAFALMGMRAGVIWCIAILSIQLLMLQAYFQGFQYPQMLDPEHSDHRRIIYWLLTFISVALVTHIYDKNNSYLRKVFHKELESNKFLAAHDALTGLANRKHFEIILHQSIERFKRYGGTLYLIYIDLDRFKPINDRYGHEMGDNLLCEEAKKLNNFCGDEYLAARLGGDEFAVLLEPADDFDIEAFVRQLSTELNGSLEIDERISIVVSIGVAQYKEGESADSFLQRADTAMYESKNDRGPWAELKQRTQASRHK